MKLPDDGSSETVHCDGRNVTSQNSPEGNNLYVVTHEHRHGCTLYHVAAARRPTVEELVESLHIDYEPERGESIDIEQVLNTTRLFEDHDGRLSRMFVNYYKCPNDGETWQDQWSCSCNDRCPVCNAEIVPHRTEEL